MSLIGSARRFFAGLALASIGAVGLVAACMTPTQVTVDVSLVKTDCNKTNGTAIIAASDPSSAEQRVDGGFPSAVTSSCADTPDDAKKEIGTLVVTPGDSDHGAIVVLVSFSKDHGAADCRPPLYTDCVVARRSFAFLDHQKLTLPIEIDQDCVNVPCDERSTCRQGQCYSSEVDTMPGSDSFEPPGVQADGAVEDVVVPDAGGEGAPVNEAGMMVPYCSSGNLAKLYCPDPGTGLDSPCTLSTGQHCWAPPSGTPTCNTNPPTVPPLCCSPADCESMICNRTSGDPGTCGVPGVMPPYCDGANQLHCFDMTMHDVVCKGTSNFCCASQSNYCDPNPSAMCTDSTKHCCSSADCFSGTCVRPGSVPGSCMPSPTAPSCDAGALECPNAPCASSICCALVSTGGPGCATKLSDCKSSTLGCCTDSDCQAAGQACPGSPILSGSPNLCAPKTNDAGSDGGSEAGVGAVCVGGALACPPDGPGGCLPGGSCCGASQTTASCQGVAACFAVVKKFCCQNGDCPQKDGGMPGTCFGAVLPDGPAGGCN